MRILALFVLDITILVTISLSSGLVYEVDDSQFGRKFDGIGGLSGGGATSKLLMNYPKTFRDQILDYLFLPQFSASLHILKVEIGGDSQSTEGTESSHMHANDDENYFRGYEWWLMKEAKKRNPNILLYGLAWAYPGWITGLPPGSPVRGNPYVQRNLTARYVVNWVRGAKLVHGLTMDFIGIWNENEWDAEYVKILRDSLDSNGFSNVKIVVGDGDWSPATTVAVDPAFSRALFAIGAHYPGVLSSKEAQQSGKALWASEDYSTYNDDNGAGCWARILNQNYVRGLMTSTISWNLVAAYYDSLPYAKCALMNAEWPWSGSFEVSGPMWITAHTTQFSQPGWYYLQHKAGVDMLVGGGSFVSLRSPDRKDYTLIIETMVHDHSQCIRPDLPPYNVIMQNATFHFYGNLGQQLRSLNVWRSKLPTQSGSQAEYFKQMPSINIVNNEFTIQLGMNEIWTLSTVANAQKGYESPNPPPPQPFPFPYSDDFNSYEEWAEPYNLVPQTGSLEVRFAPDILLDKSVGSSMANKVLLQTVLQQPVDWCDAGSGLLNSRPIALIGNYSWNDLHVEIDIAIPSTVTGHKLAPTSLSASGAFIGVRVDTSGCGTQNAHGIYLFADFTAAKLYLTTDLVGKNKLAIMDYIFAVDTWYQLTLHVENGLAMAYVDDTYAFTVTLPSSVPSNGFVGVGSNEFGFALFDNLLISPPFP